MVFAEALAEYLTDGLRAALSRHETTPPPLPLVADRYIALSALQKAVRRGDEDLALRAAMTLMTSGPRAFWRRLGIIAFEDVGVANIDLVGRTIVVIGKTALRQHLGGDWRVADVLVRALCRSAKCRAADDLVHVIERTPSLADLRDALPATSLRHRIGCATDQAAALEARALATWFAVGTEKLPSPHLDPVRGCPENTFDALRDADLPGIAVEIGRMGLERTGCILAAMFPLLYAARPSDDLEVEDNPLPAETVIGSIPGWVLDVHTRSGLAGFGRYRRRSDRMQAYLDAHADPGASLNRVVGSLVFRMESGLVTRRLVWEEARRLREAADLLRDGLPPDAVPEGLAILRDEIDLLNRCRTEAAPDYLR